MSINHLLEDFSSYASSTSVEMTDVLLEEQRLEAFEKGYQAGWDDSAAAKKTEAGQVSSDFSQALSDLSFTYAEAFSGLAKGIQPLMLKIVHSVLPKIASQTLGARLSEILTKEVERHGKSPVQIHVAASQVEAVQSLLDKNPGLPAEVRADETLIEGQLRLLFANGNEQEIDVPELIQNISAAIDAFFNDDSNRLQKETA